jgi:hypothetical protein
MRVMHGAAQSTGITRYHWESDGSDGQVRWQAQRPVLARACTSAQLERTCITISCISSYSIVSHSSNRPGLLSDQELPLPDELLPPLPPPLWRHLARLRGLRLPSALPHSPVAAPSPSPSWPCLVVVPRPLTRPRGHPCPRCHSCPRVPTVESYMCSLSGTPSFGQHPSRGCSSPVGPTSAQRADAPTQSAFCGAMERPDYRDHDHLCHVPAKPAPVLKTPPSSLLHTAADTSKDVMTGDMLIPVAQAAHAHASSADPAPISDANVREQHT